MSSRLSQLFPERTYLQTTEGLIAPGGAYDRLVLSPEPQLVITGRRFEGVSDRGSSHVWKPAYVSDTEITITGGTLRYGLSTFTPDGSAVAVTADVLNYVYLKLTCSTTFNAGYLSSATISAAAFEASTTAKTDTETAKYVLLFEWEDNTKKQQHLYWSLGGSFYTHAEDVSGFRTWAAG